MRHRWTFAALALLSLGGATAGAEAQAEAGTQTSTVSYQVTPELTASGLDALIVEARFNADASGRTLLELPDHGGRDKDWWRLLSDLHVEGATVEETAPAERRLTSAPGAAIVVRYRVRSGYDHDPTAEDANPYRPVIRPTWFQVLGERIFVAPKGRQKAPVRFSWGPLPTGWQAVSDLQHRTAQTIDSAQNSVMMGGADIRVVERPTAQGGLLRVASRGSWSFTPDALADRIAQVSEAEDKFWGEGGKPFLVSLIPLAPSPKVHSSGGRGLSEAFALYEEPDARLEDFPYLLAHERMHAWIPSGLGGLPEEKEALDYWFSEGFADFYAARLLLRSGAWTLDEFVAQENEVLARYGQSAVRNAPNARIQEGFWTDNRMQQLPYDRGRLLATLWDADLQRASDGRLGLDAVMRRQRAVALENDVAGSPVWAAALFPSVFRQVSGRDLAPDLARYVEAGETVRLPDDLYGACAVVTSQTIPAFDRGFDADKSAETGVFTEVDPAGPAYAAGLRNGMKRLAREGGKDGDSRVEIGYRVLAADGRAQVVRYRPAGKRLVAIQQVRLAEGLSADQRAACARQMSGGA